MISFMLISAMAIATLRIELISRNIFNKSYNNIDKNIKNIINIGKYEDIMNIKDIVTIKENLVLIDGNNIKFLEISLKENNESHYSKFRMFYEK